MITSYSDSVSIENAGARLSVTASDAKCRWQAGGNTVSQNALGRLRDLAVFVSAEEDLRAHLRELSDLAASVTQAATCSIMMLSEGGDEAPRLKLWSSTEALPPAAWNEAPRS